jgi:hypothetical protein
VKVAVKHGILDSRQLLAGKVAVQGLQRVVIVEHDIDARPSGGGLGENPVPHLLGARPPEVDLDRMLLLEGADDCGVVLDRQGGIERQLRFIGGALPKPLLAVAAGIGGRADGALRLGQGVRRLQRGGEAQGERSGQRRRSVNPHGRLLRTRHG